MADLPPELASRPKRKAGQEPSATLTIEAYTRLKAELDELKTDGREKIPDRLRHARGPGDTTENAESTPPRTGQGWREPRTRKPEPILRDPDIVEAPPPPAPVMA